VEWVSWLPLLTLTLLLGIVPSIILETTKNGVDLIVHQVLG